MTKDPRLEFPEDLGHISTSMPPAGRGLSQLRRLIGILPNPLGSVQPRVAAEEGGGNPPADPQSQLGSGIGAQHGTGAIHEQTMNPGAIPGSAIIPGTVSGGAIAAGAITATSIAADSITANHIQANAVTASELAANSVTADELAANSVTAADIQAGTITATEIATGTITGVKLADGTVTAVKIDSITANQIETGTLSAITITACDISAGGGGFDGFEVLDGSGFVTGFWNSGDMGTVTIFAAEDGLYSNGVISSTNVGVVTRVVAGAFSNVPPNSDGQLGIDSSNFRFYFHYGGAWHYVAQTAGFEIPEYERLCPACGLELAVDDPVVGRITDTRQDGARHGLYVHFGCAQRPLQPALVAGHLAAAAAGTSGGEPVPDAEPTVPRFAERLAAHRARNAGARAAHRARSEQAESRRVVEAELEREVDAELVAAAGKAKAAIAAFTVQRAKPLPKIPD